MTSYRSSCLILSICSFFNTIHPPPKPVKKQSTKWPKFPSSEKKKKKANYYKLSHWNAYNGLNAGYIFISTHLTPTTWEWAHVNCNAIYVTIKLCNFWVIRYFSKMLTSWKRRIWGGRHVILICQLLLNGGYEAKDTLYW